MHIKNLQDGSCRKAWQCRPGEFKSSSVKLCSLGKLSFEGGGQNVELLASSRKTSVKELVAFRLPPREKSMAEVKMGATLLSYHCGILLCQ